MRKHKIIFAAMLLYPALMPAQPGQNNSIQPWRFGRYDKNTYEPQIHAVVFERHPLKVISYRFDDGTVVLPDGFINNISIERQPVKIEPAKTNLMTLPDQQIKK